MHKLRRRVLLLGSSVIASTVLTLAGCHRSGSPEEKTEATESVPDTDQARVGAVHLDSGEQKRMGLAVKALTLATHQPRVELYGNLESDPAEVFVVRAPTAGRLQANRGDWPVLGSRVGDHTSVGSIVPQLTGADQLTLSDRLSTVQAQVATDTAAVAAATAEYQRLTTLNAEDKNVSDRALQEAEVRMKGDQAQLKAARQSQTLLQSALQGNGKASFIMPLIAARGGEVSEVLAQPGEVVEAGQLIFRISRFVTLIARLNLPLSQQITLPITSAVITVAGDEKNAIPAPFLAEASVVQSEYQSKALLFRVTSPDGALRPGEAVEGWVPTQSGSRESGVLIPSSAVVSYQNQNWVYVQVSDTEFVRRPIILSEPTEDGWFVTSGFRAGDRIAVVGAQTVLSEEMKSQLNSDED